MRGDEPSASTRQRFGALVIDREAHEVTLDGRAVALTKAEFALLSTLAANPRRALSSRDLLRAMWGSEWSADTTALQVHVSRLRAKLNENGSRPRHIVTVHGFGYRFEPEPSVQHAAARLDRLEAMQAGDDIAAFALVSADRRIVGVSSHVERLLGWRPGELEGTVTYDLVHPDDAPGLRSLRERLDAGVPVALIARFRTADGGYRRIEGLVRPVIHAGERVELFVHQWRPAPEDGREHEPGPHATDRPVGHGSLARRIELVVGRDLVLRSVTPREPFLGFDPDEIVGTFFSPTGLDETSLQAFIDALLSTGTLRTVNDVTLLDATGKRITVHQDATIHLDPNGAFDHLVSILTLPG